MWVGILYIFVFWLFLVCCCCSGNTQKLSVDSLGNLRINHKGVSITWYFGQERPKIYGNRDACNITYNGNTARIKIGDSLDHQWRFK